MRFETDVLTLKGCPCGCSGPVGYGGRGANNYACDDDIRDAGWLLPEEAGSRIVLVFSTTRVAGASRCLTSDLRSAGLRAMERDGTVFYQPLWWWPEIVTGGAS